MLQYHQLLRLVLEQGKFKADRTGTGTYSVFGAQARFPQRRLSAADDQKLHMKSIIYELLWFLRGDTNVKWLNEHGVSIWDEWADEHGDLGCVSMERNGATGGPPTAARLPNRSGDRSNQDEPRQPAPDRHRLESGRA
jgi:thymidylate synthase